MSSTTYNNNPGRRAKGRILFDVTNINKDSERLAEQDGVYFKFNVGDDIVDTKYKMMLIGPEDSPYVGGFYTFDAQFPDQYPYFPMTMKTRTQGGSIRKHPNLYVSGKCCFSFLGTWSGPPWTACQNPETVAISMKSVLTNNPIVNEPGWEKKNDARTKLYETMVRYFNIRYAVINVIKTIDNSPFKVFKEDIEKNFVKFYSHYLKEVKVFEKYSGMTKNSPVYGFSVTFDVDFVKQELTSIYEELSKKFKDVKVAPKKEDDEVQVNISSETVVNQTSEVEKLTVKKKLKIKKKIIRKAPKESASKSDEGKIAVGLDGNQWQVKKYESGVKRWVKCK